MNCTTGNEGLTSSTTSTGQEIWQEHQEAPGHDKAEQGARVANQVILSDKHYAPVLTIICMAKQNYFLALSKEAPPIDQGEERFQKKKRWLSWNGSWL